MATCDVLTVLKLQSPTARAILRTFKTTLVPINHEMQSRSYDFLYLPCKTIVSFQPSHGARSKHGAVESVRVEGFQQ